ncbi:MAG TPA: ATP-binding protein, partial [Thermoleophilaceae bacterium]|nr:ATP-binding protein [Thermoleophilaceae bacterium]
EGQVDPVLVSATRLLVSELVTNSVRHGGGERVRLKLQVPEEGRLRCEVTDDGPGFTPAPRDRAATEPGGWGLVLVDQLVDKWGVQDGRTKVWFELSAASS